MFVSDCQPDAVTRENRCVGTVHSASEGAKSSRRSCCRSSLSSALVPLQALCWGLGMLELLAGAEAHFVDPAKEIGENRASMEQMRVLQV